MINTGFTRALFNSYSSHKNTHGVEQVPQNVQNNYKNKISRGNYEAAYNTISKYLPYYKRNNLANLVGQFATHPVREPPPYNASLVNIKRNNNAKTYINRARSGNSKRMVEILQPYRGGKGGVQLGYLSNRLNKNPIKYAMVNRGTGNLYAFALLENNKYEPNSRYLNIVGGLKGYGGKLIKKVINNARANGKNTLNLKAVVTKTSNIKKGKIIHRVPVNNQGKRNGLVSLYEYFGFNTNGRYVNYQGLQPMTLYLKNKQTVLNKRRAMKKRKANIAASMITPRVTRSRAGP
jgi:ribosomal protein L22